ncbi:hypothetical protein ACB092_12G055400 [Castanea dentata]
MEDRIKKMNEAKRPIEIWMLIHRFPRQMKRDIMQCVINSLERKQDVNVKNLLHHLPEELRNKAKRFLYLDLLKKVSSFATINLVDNILSLCIRIVILLISHKIKVKKKERKRIINI